MPQLIGIVIDHDTNEYGEPAYFTTPRYEVPSRDGGTVCVSVPDTKGWPTREEAFRDALTILAANDIDEMHAEDMIKVTTEALAFRHQPPADASRRGT